MKRLNKEFFKKSSMEVGRELLGKYLVHNTSKGKIIGKIVELEVYGGTIDKAAHSYKGRRTNRTEVMYSEGGVCYVYLIYGMYNCLNFVCSEKDNPEAILIRAIEPIENTELMCENRYNKPLNECSKKQLINLTNGPGKLCKALNIDRSLNGESLENDTIYVFEDKHENFEIVETTRIGIGYAEEAQDYLWRFYIKDNPYVSRK